MKKVIYSSLIALSLTAGITSCDDILDAPTKSSMDESVIFSTPALAEGAIAGVIQSFCETNSYRGRFLVHYGTNNDCEVTNSLRTTTGDAATLANYMTTPGNGQMNTENNAYAKFYEGIERANLAIRGIRTYGNVESNKEMAQILGEMLTLRAVVYSDLLKAWGDVPARFEPISTETVYVPRADRDVIYKQLLADLEEAAELVEWPNATATTKSTERVNKAFVKGLRSRLALAAGGYGQRMDGTIRKSTDPELASDKMYEIVKKECLEVINSGTCQLLGFEEAFKEFCGEKLTAGLETLWEIPFSDGRGRVIFDLGLQHTNTDKYTGQARGGNNGPNPALFYDYDKDDVRRDVTCIPYVWTDGIQVPGNLNKWCFGKYRYEWLPRVVTSTNDDGLNWLYMRYSDVILMAAEAINELDGPAAAAPYLKMVRERAFPNSSAKVSSFMTAVTASKEAFFNAIVDERAFEFTGEKLRKGDLIRWNLLGSKIKESQEKLKQLANREGKYANLPSKIYYKNEGEEVIIYGLEFGDTDEKGVSLGYTSSKNWNLLSDSDAVPYYNCLALRDPDLQQYWPIWQTFVDSSNGLITNDGYNQP
ncbi:RagB/SusD family nutrient uptake outer membrane protein [Bacteroides sp. 519]|uniref:RagB/SusD family nutrient uptake outer membrane protein n=1 Tax=Bacteroides sp. 519 TaxID=2302937 RepID=UPI0013D1042C|nr:RagB/SusD family nutrient uptake outer membrane protein [Bacteroides sp. 519]NDV57182.1 RagB/SusD family nutrient uptake outer membrane protein [Bacteroides sp. 519]